MEILTTDTLCIITPLGSKLDSYQSSRLINKISKITNLKLALNLDYVYDCTIDFIEDITKLAKEKEIGVFNINSEVFTIFNLMNLDKFVKLYVSELDFESESRRLINRKFSVV